MEIKVSTIVTVDPDHAVHEAVSIQRIKDSIRNSGILISHSSTVVVSGYQRQNHEVLKISQLSDGVGILPAQVTNVEVTLIDLNATKISFPVRRSSTITDLDDSLLRRTGIDRNLALRGLYHNGTNVLSLSLEPETMKLQELGSIGNSITLHAMCIFDHNIRIDVEPLCGGQSSREVDISRTGILRDIMEDVCHQQGKNLSEVLFAIEGKACNELDSPEGWDMRDSLAVLDFCSDSSGKNCDCREKMFSAPNRVKCKTGRRKRGSKCTDDTLRQAQAEANTVIRESRS